MSSTGYIKIFEQNVQCEDELGFVGLKTEEGKTSVNVLADALHFKTIPLNIP